MIHIGEKIKERIEEVGISKSEFARRIDKARQNIEIIFNKKSVDTELLLEISKALDYDFFQHYYNHNYSTNVVSEFSKIKEEFEILKNDYNQLLKKYIDILEHKGIVPVISNGQSGHYLSR